VDCCQAHVAKVAQSATATWPKPFHVSKKVGPGIFLKQIFFYRDVFKKNKLQGQKSKHTQITGTNCIFKPLNIYHKIHQSIFMFRAAKHGSNGIRDKRWLALKAIYDIWTFHIFIHIIFFSLFQSHHQFITFITFFLGKHIYYVIFLRDIYIYVIVSYLCLLRYTFITLLSLIFVYQDIYIFFSSKYVYWWLLITIYILKLITTFFFYCLVY